jgi:hypothetical protein
MLLCGHRPTRRAALLLTVAGCVLSHRPAIAAEPTSAEIAAARQLFADARAAEEAEDWTSAASKIRQAISIKETPGLRFHLAYCEEHLGMLVEALVDYERAEDAARSKNDDVEKKVGPRKEALRKRTPTITVLLAADMNDAALAIDGHAVASTLIGKPIPQNPGKHHVVASAPGRRPYSADLALAEADSIVVTVALPAAMSPEAQASSNASPASQPAGSESVASRAATAEAWSPRTYVLVGEAVVTIAAIGVGVGYMLSASAAEDRSDRYRGQLPPSLPGYPDPCWGSGSNQVACADLEQAVAEAKDRRFLSKIGFVGAGVGAVAFAATWLFWKSPPSKQAIGPLLTREMAGLYVIDRF